MDEGMTELTESEEFLVGSIEDLIRSGVIRGRRRMSSTRVEMVGKIELDEDRLKFVTDRRRRRRCRRRR